jgi:hypothetical protein
MQHWARRLLECVMKNVRREMLDLKQRTAYDGEAKPERTLGADLGFRFQLPVGASLFRQSRSTPLTKESSLMPVVDKEDLRLSAIEVLYELKITGHLPFSASDQSLTR